MKTGIDSLAVYIPKLYVDLTGQWAVVRASQLGEASVDKLVGKVTRGVGLNKMAIPDAHEDPATMAAMAAIRLLDQDGIDPRDIGYLAIGTETTVDQSKSISAYVLGMLERYYDVDLRETACPQFQFACMGASYALQAANSLLRSGELAKPYALVIATDIARYPLQSAGEYTQGAGAVAMLLARDPKLLTLDPGLTCTVTRDERDFFRPNWRRTAVVDGKYSVDVYLDCMEAAFQAYLQRCASAGVAVGPADDPPAAFGSLLFHVPFPRMAEYAAARLLGLGWRQRADLELDPGAFASRRDFERALAKTPRFQALQALKVEPSLVAAREVGNLYSGSLYLALASFVEQAARTGRNLAGERALFASYGSGASAMVFSGQFEPTWQEAANQLDLTAHLAPAASGGRRLPLELADYEHLHQKPTIELALSENLRSSLEHGAALSKQQSAELAAVLDGNHLRLATPMPSVCPPAQEFYLAQLGTEDSAEKVDVGYRYYGYAGVRPGQAEPKAPSSLVLQV